MVCCFILLESLKKDFIQTWKVLQASAEALHRYQTK